MAGDVFDEIGDAIVDEICNSIAEAAAEECVGTMLGMCGNAGQEAIIGDVIDQVMDQIEAISNGEAEGLESSHDEAVGEILEAGSEILEGAADMCSEIRDAAEAL